MTNCAFCLQNDLLEVPIVYQDETWMMLDMKPLEGSVATLLVTKRHIETPFELSEDEWGLLRPLIGKAKRHLDEQDHPQGYNIGWNVYEAGGQTVPHAHLHVAARYDDEELAGKGIRYHFKPHRNQRKSPLG